MSIAVGSVHVDVLPSTRDFVKKMKADLLGEADKIGEDIGRRLGAQIADELQERIGRGVSEGIEDGVDDADTTRSATRQGRRTGDAFGKAFRREIRAALEALPDVELDLDSDGALGEIAIIRQQLNLLNDAELGVDLDAEGALRSIAEIRAELLAISDRDIDLDFDIRQARAALGQLERDITRRFQDSQGGFARGLRQAIDNAVRDLPDIDVDVDIDVDRTELFALNALLEELGNKRLGIDIDADAALDDLAELQALLTALGERTTNVQVESDVAAAVASIETFLARYRAEEIQIQVDPPELGAFATKLKADIARMSATLPDIQIEADTSEVLREVAQLRSQLANISANIDIDTDIASVLLKLQIVQQAVEALDREDVDINIDADLTSLLAQLAAVRAATDNASGGVRNLGDAVDNNTGRIQRWRLILAAVVLLLPLIAGAVVALSAALALVITPIAAVALGMDGIREAAIPLADDFVRLRDSASRAFAAGLVPAVENLAKLFPVLTEGVAGTAIAMSDVTTGVTALVTSGRNLDTIASSFDLINGVILSMGPAVNLLTQNMIDLTNIGLQGMSTFGVELQQVGEAFRVVIERLNASGTAQAAVRALFQVIAELLNLLAPLTEFGSVLLATFGPALAAALSVIGAAFGVFAQVLDSLPGPIQTVVTAALLMGTTFLVLGRALPGTATAIAFLSGLFPALALSTNVAAVALRGFFAILGGPIGIAIIAVVTALSFLGQAQSEAAQGAGEHQAAVQELAGALRQSGGAITDNIRELTAKKLIDSGAADSAQRLGLTTAELTSALVEQGPAYTAIIAGLEAQVAAGEAATAGYRNLTPEQQANAQLAREQGAAASELLGVLAPLGQQFVDAAAYNRELAAALKESGQSLVGGTVSAAQFAGAIETLEAPMSSTADKAKALADALDALNGGVLTADEAASALRESIAELGTAFDEARAATREAGVDLIMANGAIDNTTEAGRALGDELSGVRDAMIESATAAFDAAGGLTDIENASAAASSEVQVARDAFIEAATAAGIGADEANRLADRYGLIPSEVVTLLSAKGLPQVNVELEQLLNRISTVPPNTEIRVTALSDEALAVLEAVGVKVTQLPDGSFSLLVDDQTRPGIEAALGYARSQSGQIPIGADANPLRTEIDAQIAALQVTKAELQLTAGTEGFQSVVDAQIAALQAQRADLPVGANPGPLQAQLPGLVASINASTAAINIDGKPQPALDALGSTLQAIAAGRESVTIDGVSVPAESVLDFILDKIRASEASVTIGGENFPAAAVLDATLAAIAAGRENVTIGGQDFPAQGVLSSLLGRVAGSSAAIQVLANAAAANAAIDFAARERTARINVVYTDSGANIPGRGTITKADGGIVIPMAGGGVLNGRNLTPMSARAQVVPKNTWRVIGDNMKVPEAYIPLDGSARSLGFTRMAARAQGYSLAPMAFGGLISSAMRLADQVRMRSTLSTQDTGAFSPLFNVPVREPRAPGRDRPTAQLEKKFDQMIEVLRTSRTVPPITVEDRSGNPTETARAVQLAIRLSR